MTPALSLEDVCVRVGQREILRGVNLQLASGEVVALAGPNGVGKTTLLRVASGVLDPARGRVALEGRPLAQWDRRALATRLAVVPQDAHIPFPFRVGEVVLMGRAPHLGALGFEGAEDIERARAALARVGIEQLADRSILEISGGERQLVLVARALAQDPRVLLLDEPTAHLDLRHRMRVLEVVRELAAADRSVLVVSHDLSLAARTSDRIALLAEGRMLGVGPPREVLTRANLSRVFEVDVDVFDAPDGTPLVVPRVAV